MSQRMVGILIDRLLADKDLRIRFALDRDETLADLSFLGLALTPEEIDVFIRTDARLWFWDKRVVCDRCTDDDGLKEKTMGQLVDEIIAVIALGDSRHPEK